MKDIDEAIKHAEEVAKERNETANLTPTEYGDYINSCRECAQEHEQLAEWLRQLKAIKQLHEEYASYGGGFYYQVGRVFDGDYVLKEEEKENGI